MAEPVNAFLYAFRKNDGGGVLLRASAAFVVLAGALWGLFLFLNRDAIGGTMTWVIDIIRLVADSGGELRIEEMPEPPAGAGAMFGGLFLLLLAYNIVLAAYEAACLRWLIHGERAGGFGLSLGFDTWRVWGVYWVWFALKLALAVVTSVIVGVSAMIRGEGWTGVERDWISFVVQIASLYFLVRWAPAAATSVGRGAFSFFESWTVTGGRFWRMLGAFAILAALLVLYHAAVFGGALWLLWPSIGANVQAVAEDRENVGLALDLIAKLFSAPNLPIIVGAYLALAPAMVFMLLAYYGICAKAVRTALDEGRIEREN
ncbi:MAG: hypothetical protein ABL883_13150 [Terricaulis sp.]